MLGTCCDACLCAIDYMLAFVSFSILGQGNSSEQSFSGDFFNKVYYIVDNDEEALWRQQARDH